jgi:hypothetical protein
MSKVAWSFAVLVVVGVGGLALAGGPAPTPAQQASCVTLFERQRTCTESFIPALVDLRVSLDRPKGIAATAKSDGRDALIAAALAEWKTDSTDASIAKTCASMPPGAVTPQMNTCLAASSCPAFSQCLVPLMRTTIH